MSQITQKQKRDTCANIEIAIEQNFNILVNFPDHTVDILGNTFTRVGVQTSRCGFCEMCTWCALIGGDTKQFWKVVSSDTW